MKPEHMKEALMILKTRYGPIKKHLVACFVYNGKAVMKHMAVLNQRIGAIENK